VRPAFVVEPPIAAAAPLAEPVAVPTGEIALAPELAVTEEEPGTEEPRVRLAELPLAGTALLGARSPGVALALCGIKAPAPVGAADDTILEELVDAFAATPPAETAALGLATAGIVLVP
jgi:hypothetical protein